MARLKQAEDEEMREHIHIPANYEDHIHQPAWNEPSRNAGPTLREQAKSILNRHGLVGQLDPVAGRWIYRGTKGSQGAAAEIEGEPDLALLEEAAAGMAAAIDADN